MEKKMLIIIATVAIVCLLVGALAAYAALNQGIFNSHTGSTEGESPLINVYWDGVNATAEEDIDWGIWLVGGNTKNLTIVNIHDGAISIVILVEDLPVDWTVTASQNNTALLVGQTSSADFTVTTPGTLPPATVYTFNTTILAEAL